MTTSSLLDLVGSEDDPTSGRDTAKGQAGASPGAGREEGEDSEEKQGVKDGASAGNTDAKFSQRASGHQTGPTVLKSIYLVSTVE